MIITIITALLKAYIDVNRWPFENHWIGFVASGMVVLTVCWISCEIFPIFLYGLVFNPAVNLMSRLPIFYIGDTSRIDQFLKKTFGRAAGHIWFFCNLILLILTI